MASKLCDNVFLSLSLSLSSSFSGNIKTFQIICSVIKTKLFVNRLTANLCLLIKLEDNHWQTGINKYTHICLGFDVPTYEHTFVRIYVESCMHGEFYKAKRKTKGGGLKLVLMFSCFVPFHSFGKISFWDEKNQKLCNFSHMHIHTYILEIL